MLVEHRVGSPRFTDANQHIKIGSPDLTTISVFDKQS